MFWLEVLYPIQFLRDFLDSSQAQDYSPVLSFFILCCLMKKMARNFGVEQSHIQIYLLWFTDAYALMYMYVISTRSTLQKIKVYICIYLHVIPTLYWHTGYRSYSCLIHFAQHMFTPQADWQRRSHEVDWIFLVDWKGTSCIWIVQDMGCWRPRLQYMTTIRTSNQVS